MRSRELTIGRTFGLVLEHARTSSLGWPDSVAARACARLTYPSSWPVRIVGTCERVDDPVAPLPSAVHLTNIEAQGGGTIAYDPDEDAIRPHIHVSAGLRELSATGRTSRLIAATVQLLTELVVVEVLSPALRRVPDPEHDNMPLLTFVP